MGQQRLTASEVEAAIAGPMSFGPGGNGRVIIRDQNGTRVYRDQKGGSRDEEMQQLREEVRRLRQQLNEKNDKDDNQDDR